MLGYRPKAVRANSGTDSIEQDDKVWGTPGMRYAALSRVEKLLAHSYSSCQWDLAPPHSPNAFGAAPELRRVARIEQRLAMASSAPADVR